MTHTHTISASYSTLTITQTIKNWKGSKKKQYNEFTKRKTNALFPAATLMVAQKVLNCYAIQVLINSERN